MDRRRLNESEIRRAYFTAPPASVELLLAVRCALLELVPRCHEVRKWTAISYQRTFPEGAVKDGICQLRLRDHHVELSFVHGAFLPDPQRLLVCSGKHKRSVTVVDADEIRCGPIRQLILASAAFRSYGDQA